MKRVLYLVLSPLKIIKEKVYLTAEQIAGIPNVDVIIGKTHNDNAVVLYGATAFIFPAITEFPKYGRAAITLLTRIFVNFISAVI